MRTGQQQNPQHQSVTAFGVLKERSQLGFGERLKFLDSLAARKHDTSRGVLHHVIVLNRLVEQLVYQHECAPGWWLHLFPGPPSPPALPQCRVSRRAQFLSTEGGIDVAPKCRLVGFLAVACQAPGDDWVGHFSQNSETVMAAIGSEGSPGFFAHQPVAFLLRLRFCLS